MNKEEKIETRRQRKLESLIRKEIEEVIRREVSDPRIIFFTITSVKITPDLRYVKVMISFMGDEKEKELAFEGIKSAEKYIQNKLAKRLFLKHMPSVEFVLDERNEYRIEKILKEIRDERDKKENN